MFNYQQYGLIEELPAAVVQAPIVVLDQSPPRGQDFPASLRTWVSTYNPAPPPPVVPGILQAQILL